MNKLNDTFLVVLIILNTYLVCGSIKYTILICGGVGALTELCNIMYKYIKYKRIISNGDISCDYTLRDINVTGYDIIDNNIIIPKCCKEYIKESLKDSIDYEEIYKKVYDRVIIDIKINKDTNFKNVLKTNFKSLFDVQLREEKNSEVMVIEGNLKAEYTRFVIGEWELYRLVELARLGLYIGEDIKLEIVYNSKSVDGKLIRECNIIDIVQGE